MALTAYKSKVQISDNTSINLKNELNSTKKPNIVRLKLLSYQ
jgi:hypothetical protein